MNILLGIILVTFMHLTLGHFILLEVLEHFAKTRKPLEKVLMVIFAPTVLLYMLFEFIDNGLKGFYEINF